jgi:AraC-like DNA-binding protein
MTTLEQLSAVRTYIDDHYDQPLSTAELARRAHLSRYHFIRLFRRFFRETPHQYLIRQRLDQAKYLLANSTLPVTDICFAVGFESVGSFSTLPQEHRLGSVDLPGPGLGAAAQSLQVYPRLFPHHV